MTISKEMAFYIKEGKMQMQMTKCIRNLTKCFSPIVPLFVFSDVMILSQKSRQKFNWISYSKKQLEYFDEVLFVYHYRSSNKLRSNVKWAARQGMDSINQSSLFDIRVTGLSEAEYCSE